MYDTTELKKGLKIEFEEKIFLVIKSDFTNPGKGSAFVKVKLRNLESGTVIERTFKSGVSTGCSTPDCEDMDVEYMYDDQDGYNFMNQKTYETIHVNTDLIGDSKGYLQEGIKLSLLFYKGKPISVELPNFVVLKVVETDPGLKGDTAAGGLKKAIMDTGLQVNVPLFIKEGELLKIDTRTGDYSERVKG
jgi:elongation factor P